MGIKWDYILEDVGSLRSELLWAKDFADAEAFIHAVTATPAWKFLRQNPTDASVFAQDVGEDLW